MADFLAMGGFAAYVWPAWAVVTVLMAGIIIFSLRSLRRQEGLLRTLELPPEMQPPQTQSPKTQSADET